MRYVGNEENLVSILVKMSDIIIFHLLQSKRRVFIGSLNTKSRVILPESPQGHIPSTDRESPLYAL